MLWAYACCPIYNFWIWRNAAPTKNTCVHAFGNVTMVLTEIDFEFSRANSTVRSTRLAFNKGRVRRLVTVPTEMFFDCLFWTIQPFIAIDADVAYSFVAVQVNVVIVVDFAADSTAFFGFAFCSTDVQVPQLVCWVVFLCALPAVFADVCVATLLFILAGARILAHLTLRVEEFVPVALIFKLVAKSTKFARQLRVPLLALSIVSISAFGAISAQWVVQILSQVLWIRVLARLC